MSLLTKGIGLAKKVKHACQDELKKRTPVYLSPVRRIERIKTGERVCAMTFDDGPCRLPAQPGGTVPLTLSLAETLERFGGKGTFDVVGDTSGNYPDEAGKHGSPSWGGVRFDHYPDIQKDSEGGAVHCPELMERLLSGGHEITSHTFAHVLYGWKPLVYGKRRYLGDTEKVRADLERLHTLLRERYGYEIRLSRPPHYVDQIEKGLTAYDVYAQLRYQYLAASFDGAGWLPLSSYEAEVEATWKPMERALSQNPDALCGQIIFQKDGFNMARRTPVADGLPRQLELLQRQGYRVVTVSQLLEQSPFADLGHGDRGFEAAALLLQKDYCTAFRDNTVRIEQPVTKGELAMMGFGWAAAQERVERLKSGGGAYFADVPAAHPYGAAAKLAVEAGCFERAGTFHPEMPLTGKLLRCFCEGKFGQTPDSLPEQPDRLCVLETLAALVK